MRRRVRFAALTISTASFVMLAGAWFALNHFRVVYYNSGMEGPSAATSPYWTIIRQQDLLRWPIIFLFVLAALMLLIEFARYIAATISKRNNHKNDSVSSDGS
jgi:hypothetical protein